MRKLSDWLLDKYTYRRQVRIESDSFRVPFLHPVTVKLPGSIVSSNKARTDFQDLEVAYGSSFIYRDVVEYDGDIYVTFQSQEELPANTHDLNYVVYMGSPGLNDVPTRLTYQAADYYPDPFELEGFEVPYQPSWSYWPNSIGHENTLVAYTRPGEHWVEGQTKTPQSRASTKLPADRIRLICQKGPNQGIIQVRVNNQEWQEVDLYSDDYELSAVFVASDLPRSTLNELTVLATGRSRYQMPEFNANIHRIDFNLSFDSLDSGEEIKPLSWSSYVGGV